MVVGKVTVQMLSLIYFYQSYPFLSLIVFLSHFGLEGGILILCITPIIQLNILQYTDKKKY